MSAADRSSIAHSAVSFPADNLKPSRVPMHSALSHPAVTASHWAHTTNCLRSTFSSSVNPTCLSLQRQRQEWAKIISICSICPFYISDTMQNTKPEVLVLWVFLYAQYVTKERRLVLAVKKEKLSFSRDGPVVPLSPNLRAFIEVLPFVSVNLPRILLFISNSFPVHFCSPLLPKISRRKNWSPAEVRFFSCRPHT